MKVYLNLLKLCVVNRRLLFPDTVCNVYADIRCDSLERGVKRKRQFSVLSLAISLEALELRPTLLYSII